MIIFGSKVDTLPQITHLYSHVSLTQIPQISQNCFVGGKSHRISPQGLTRIQQIQQRKFVKFVQSVFVFPATNYFQWMAVRKRRYATATRMATMV